MWTAYLILDYLHQYLTQRSDILEFRGKLLPYILLHLFFLSESNFNRVEFIELPIFISVTKYYTLNHGDLILSFWFADLFYYLCLQQSTSGLGRKWATSSSKSCSWSCFYPTQTYCQTTFCQREIYGSFPKSSLEC